MKYNEKKILKEVGDYIESTYGQHYVGKHGVQTLDLLHSIGISEEVICHICVCELTNVFNRIPEHHKKIHRRIY